MFDLRLLLPLANRAQIRTELTAGSIYSMTVLTTSVMEESSPTHLIPMFFSSGGGYETLPRRPLVDEKYGTGESG